MLLQTGLNFEDLEDVDFGAESKKQSKSMFTKDKRGRMYARNRKGQIITHNAENQSAVYEPSSEPTVNPCNRTNKRNPNLFGSDMLKPIKKNKDWLSLALGTTAVVLGGIIAQSKGWLNFGADGDEAKEEVYHLPPQKNLLL